MTMPTWEIVALTLAVLGVAAVSIYFLIRCWKSMTAMGKDSPFRKPKSSDPKRRWQTHYPNNSLDGTQIYGVPYRSPPPAVPQPLDPARLDALVMQGKSDLHPNYLQYKDGFGDITTETLNDTQAHRVTWNGESALLESVFLPSITESPILEMNRDSSIIMNGSPPKKKKVHVDYNRGQDGAPEINDITTDSIETQSDPGDLDSSTENNDAIKNSTPISARSEEARELDIKVIGGEVAEVEHVTLSSSNERTLLKAPKGRWVSFDEDTPTVVIQDERGFIKQRLEFDT